MPSLVSALVLWGVSGPSRASYVCPGSAAFMHASCKITADASANCAEVREEMLARVYSQFSSWHDPHNSEWSALKSHASGACGWIVV